MSVKVSHNEIWNLKTTSKISIKGFGFSLLSIEFKSAFQLVLITDWRNFWVFFLNGSNAFAYQCGIRLIFENFNGFCCTT